MPFLSPSLTLPQVITWILVRDHGRINLVSDDTLLSSCETAYAQYLVKQRIPRQLRKCVEIDPSRLAEADLKGAPPHERPLRKFLKDAGVGPDKLSDLLRPENVAYFFGTVLMRLERWYRLKGNSEDQVKALVQAYLRELTDLLENNGVKVRLLELAQRALHARLVAQDEWSGALAQLISALSGDHVQATGRKNGIGDPESVPAYFWPHLTFAERRIAGRGLLSCACYKDDPIGDCWSDLRFDSASIAAAFPDDTAPESQGQEKGISPRPVIKGGKKRRRGRKPKKRIHARDAMLKDLRSGQVTPASLEEMPDKALQVKYGDFSRDTMTKARGDALSEFQLPTLPTKTTNDK